MTDDVLIESIIEEDLEDVHEKNQWHRDAVLWSTDWTAETIISQLNRNNIELDPIFQRRSAWNEVKQSLFIESLILGLPIPQIILAENPAKRGSFIVIDGKQRLLAIRRFGLNEQQSDFSPLVLKGLGPLAKLNRKRYSDLIKDSELSEELSAFENSSIRTLVIRNWKDESYLYEVFLRINTGSVQLSPQELRQALHPGEFSRFVNNASAESVGLRDALKISKPDFRMRDAEILLRYFSYKNFIRIYSGNMKYFLDFTTNNINRNWEEFRDLLEMQLHEMECAFSFTKEVFGEEHYLRKWNGREFESRKNRAVFDIMLHYFSVDSLRSALESKAEYIKPRFVELCEDDRFRASLETTTKSLDANRIRFNLWGGALEELSGINLDQFKFPG